MCNIKVIGMGIINSFLFYFSNPISLQIGKMILERIEPNQRMEFVNQTAGETLKTALHFAAEVGNAEMVKLLVANGANKDAMDREVGQNGF